MSIKLLNCTALTGGGVRALDNYSIADIADGYRAHTVVSDKFYIHVYDADGTDAEDSPNVIRPDDYAGAGVWKLAGSPYGDLAVMPAIVSGLPIEGEISGGDIVKTSDHVLTISPISCLSSDLTTQLYTSTSKTLTIPTAANTIYHIFAVKLVADGSIEFRAYTTEAAVASDAQVSKYRWIGFWKTNGSSNCCEGLLSGDCFAFLKASESTFVTGFSSTSFTTLTITSVVPVSRITEIYIGLTAISAETGVTLSVDGVNGTTFITGYSGSVSDTGTPWGYSTFGFALRQIPIKNGSLYAKIGSGTASLGIAQVRIRR